MASWLPGHARPSSAAAFHLIRAGRALEHLPTTASAFAAGLITADQITVIAPVVSPANRDKAAEQDIDLTEIDRTLADVAATRPHDQLRQVVQHYLTRLDPDGPEPDPTDRRSLSIAKHADGSISGRFELDAVGGEKAQSVLESFVHKDRPAGDLRTRAQQLGDALVQWADVTLAAGQAPVLRTVKPHVFVTIPLADLVDPGWGRQPGRPGSAPRSPRPGPAGWPATARSPGSSWAPTGGCWTWAAATGSPRHTCARPSSCPTGAVCSPAAEPPRTGATSTMSKSGSPTRAPPR